MARRNNNDMPDGNNEAVASSVKNEISTSGSSSFKPTSSNLGQKLGILVLGVPGAQRVLCKVVWSYTSHHGSTYLLLCGTVLLMCGVDLAPCNETKVMGRRHRFLGSCDMYYKRRCWHCREIVVCTSQIPNLQQNY